MNITYILDFIKTQLDGITDYNSPESGEVLLMISAFMLEQIEKEPVVFTRSSDERALRRSFLYCSKISRMLNDFADQYSAPIRQKAQQALATITENEKKLSNIQHDCEDSEAKAEALLTQSRKLETANSELIAAQSALKARQKEYDNLSTTVEALRKIQSEITDEKLSVLRYEIESLEPEVQKRQSEYQELYSRHKELSKQLGEMTQRVSTTKEEDKKLKIEIQRKQSELDKLKNSITTHQQKITDLAAAIQNANNEFNELHELIEANNIIAKSIQNSGYVMDDKLSPNSFFLRVETLNQRAADLEMEYNLLLKNVLDDVSALLKNLAARQEPNYAGGGER